MSGMAGEGSVQKRLLTKRLLEVADDFERRSSAERARLEDAAAAAQSKVHQLRSALDSERVRSRQQAERIEALQTELRDSQVVETLQNKERLLEQGKLLKEVESLRSEVMALRFQLASAASRDASNSSTKNKSLPSPSGENSDPNASTPSSKANSSKDKQSHSGSNYEAQLLRAARGGSVNRVRALLNPEPEVVASALLSYKSTLSTALLHAASGPEVEGLAAAGLALSEQGGVESEGGADDLAADMVDKIKDGQGEKGDSTETVSLLVRCGASPFERDSASKWNAVHHASHAGNESVLEKLLSFGHSELSVHLEDTTRDDCHTALHLAALRCHPLCVRLLLRAGADVSARDAQGRSALDIVLAASEATSETSPNPDSPDGKTASSGGLSPEDASLIRAAEEHVREQARLTLDELNDPQTLFWSHSTRANRLYGIEDYEGARNAYSEAIALTERLPDERITSDANSATLCYNSARACAKVGRHCEATRACTNAIELRGGYYPNAMAQRASSYMALLDYNRAVSDYQQLLNDASRKKGPGSPSGSSSDDWSGFLDRARDLATKATNHYLVLGVPHDATSTMIKKAFRKQCLRWHPDKHRNTEDDTTRASIMFKAINEANEVLSDEQKRTLYDIDRISDRMDDIVNRDKWPTSNPKSRYNASSRESPHAPAREKYGQPQYQSYQQKPESEANGPDFWSWEKRRESARSESARSEARPFGGGAAEYFRGDSFRSARSSASTNGTNAASEQQGSGRNRSGSSKSPPSAVASDTDDQDIFEDSDADVELDNWARRRKKARGKVFRNASAAPDSDFESDEEEEEEIFSETYRRSEGYSYGAGSQRRNGSQASFSQKY